MANIFEHKCREIYFELKQIGLEENESWAEAKLIIEHVTGIKQAKQLTSNEKDFSTKWLSEISRILNLRRQRRPLAYCLGEIEFAGLSFRIIPGVLIPRVDTETLVEAVVAWAEKLKNQNNELPKLRIAEIGVGSGIIAISLLKRLPGCMVWACDISEVATTLALGNARRHNVQERLMLVHGDWQKNLPHDFDIIVSNPPYIPALLASLPELSAATNHALRGADKYSNGLKKHLQSEIYFEPKEALFAGQDGLHFYKQFAKLLPAHYSSSKTANQNAADLLAELPKLAAFEIGDDQEQAILSIFKNSGWTNLLTVNDTNGLPRVIMASPPKH